MRYKLFILISLMMSSLFAVCGDGVCESGFGGPVGDDENSIICPEDCELTISIPDTSFYISEGSFSLPITISSPIEVEGIEFDIVYDRNVIDPTILTLSSGLANQGYALVPNINIDNEMHILIYAGINLVVIEGLFLTIEFDIVGNPGEMSVLDFTSVEINNDNLISFVSNGQVQLLSINGCTDPTSCNYDINAGQDDGSCWTAIEGCECSDGEGAALDLCGVCNGGDVGLDCAYECFGDAILDCLGECNGSAILDDCDVCNGNNFDMDCAGICDPNTTQGYIQQLQGKEYGAILDDCGVCSEGEAYVCDLDIGEESYDLTYEECESADGEWILHTFNVDMDCESVCFGISVFDCTGKCNGEVLLDCTGECGGSVELDDCGICDGPGAVFACGCSDISDGDCDCKGNVLDDCGVCGGDGFPIGSCDCDGTPPEYNYDCYGNCIVSIDCAGDCNGTAEIDDCGVCDGNNVGMDCEGECFGDAAMDCSGVCNGIDDPDDCDVCGGNNEDKDDCDVCFGDNSTCTGCHNTDACNYLPDPTFIEECTYPVNYPENIYDCDENCLFDVDECGVCNGDGSSCTMDLGDELLPDEIILFPAYPNPFNPSTTIQFYIQSFRAVEVSIYDIHGNLSQLLLQDQLPAGHHQLVWDASDHSAGIYIIKIQSVEFTTSQKLLLIK